MFYLKIDSKLFLCFPGWIQSLRPWSAAFSPLQRSQRLTRLDYSKALDRFKLKTAVQTPKHPKQANYEPIEENTQFPCREFLIRNCFQCGYSSGFSPVGCRPKRISFSRMVVRVTPSQRAALA